MNLQTGLAELAEVDGPFAWKLFERAKSGGGVALLYASKELDNLVTANFDQKIGVKLFKILSRQAPVHTIAANAGVEGDVVVGKLLEQDNPDLGYDAAKGSSFSF
ncbi:hypothetical protein L1887_30292 [Cichorium endivia]|nr:hypothetical protein L1887_30292 [Cichorium endivia]